MSPIQEPRALAMDALSQDWQGRSMYVSSVSPAQQGYSETSVDTGGRSDSDSPLVAKTVMVLLGPLCYKLITIVNCYLETGLSCIVY